MTRPATLTPAASIVRTSGQLDWVDLKFLPGLTGQEEARFATVIVKELVDNAIDISEQEKRAPLVYVNVHQEGDATTRITVWDDGPGFTAEALAMVGDFTSRASSKEYRKAPTRGQQGNAFKTILGVPVAYQRKANPQGWRFLAAEVLAGDAVYQLWVEVDGGAVRTITEKTDRDPAVWTCPLARVGRQVFAARSAVSVCLPSDRVDSQAVGRILAGYAPVNPHLGIAWALADEDADVTPLDRDWRPSDKSHVCWYTDEDFARLCEAGRQLDWDLFTMAGTLAGLTAKGPRREIIRGAGLEPSAKLRDLDASGEQQRRLLAALRLATELPDPGVLKPVGSAALMPDATGEAEGRYAKMTGEWTVGAATVPFLIEAALVESNDTEGASQVQSAINYAPTYTLPWPGVFMGAADGDAHGGAFQGYGLSSFLGSLLIDASAPVRLHLHLVCPGLEFSDRGKSTIRAVPEMIAAAAEVLRKVAKPHYLKEKRHRKQASTIRHVKLSPQGKFTWYMREVAQLAYDTARGSFDYARNRQVFYQARPLFQQIDKRLDLKDQYFLGTLLPDFMDQNPELTGDWLIFKDARGHLVEPHTGIRVGLGTEAVQQYQAKKREREQARRPWQFPTSGPGDRYSLVLFVEKEGFDDLIEDSGMMEEFDALKMSTKGHSSIAARRFLEGAQHQCTLVAVHDFDVSGIVICGALSRDTPRHRFKERPTVHDLGIRLADVEQLNLPHEIQVQKKDMREALRYHGATEDEIRYLMAGRRVELNALNNDQIVAFLRRKIEPFVKKVVPDVELLKRAYAEAVRAAREKEWLDRVRPGIAARPIPKIGDAALVARVTKAISADSSRAWDDAIWDLAQAAVRREKAPR